MSSIIRQGVIFKEKFKNNSKIILYHTVPNLHFFLIFFLNFFVLEFCDYEYNFCIVLTFWVSLIFFEEMSFTVFALSSFEIAN